MTLMPEPSTTADDEPDCWDRMILRAAEEMASWSGPVPSGVDGFRPYAEKALRAALEMKQCH